MLTRNLLCICLITFALAACATPVDPRTLSQANVPEFIPATKNTNDSPTIRGIYEPSTGLLGTPASLTYLVSIDGMFLATRDKTAPAAVPAGFHAVALGLKYSTATVIVPAYFEFKPGASYVIRHDRKELTLETLDANSTSDVLWVEDEKTGLAVTPKITSDVYDSKIRYVPPSNASSTISGSSKDTFIDPIYAFVQMVDGAVVNGDGPTTFLSGEKPRPEYAVPIAPGLHGLSIRSKFANSYTQYPIMFDVKPDTTYVVKYDGPHSKMLKNRVILTVTIWIENAGTGEIVFPKTDMTYGLGKIYSQEELGIPDKSEPTPSLPQVFNLDSPSAALKATAG